MVNKGKKRRERRDKKEAEKNAAAEPEKTKFESEASSSCPLVPDPRPGPNPDVDLPRTEAEVDVQMSVEMTEDEASSPTGTEPGPVAKASALDQLQVYSDSEKAKGTSSKSETASWQPDKDFPSPSEAMSKPSGLNSAGSRGSSLSQSYADRAKPKGSMSKPESESNSRPPGEDFPSLSEAPMNAESTSPKDKAWTLSRQGPKSSTCETPSNSHTESPMEFDEDGFSDRDLLQAAAQPLIQQQAEMPPGSSPGLAQIQAYDNEEKANGTASKSETNSRRKDDNPPRPSGARSRSRDGSASSSHQTSIRNYTEKIKDTASKSESSSRPPGRGSQGSSQMNVDSTRPKEKFRMRSSRQDPYPTSSSQSQAPGHTPRNSRNQSPRAQGPRKSRFHSPIQFDDDGVADWELVLALMQSEVDQSPSKQETAACKVEPKRFKFVETKGDLFGCPEDESLAHCISADVRMGKGIAVGFKKQFGGVEELLRQGQRPGGLAILKRKTRFIYYLVTKEEYFNKPTYQTMYNSLKKMRDHCVKNRVEKLSMPLIGCGLDKLKWPKVVHIIEELFKDTNVTITVYKWEEEVPECKLHWEKGDNCRAIYGRDGERYEAVIKSINKQKGFCFVRYPDYGNENEKQTLAKLLPSEIAGATGPADRSDVKSAACSDVKSAANHSKEGFEIKETKGDLFRSPPDESLVHCISADVRMGKGIAVEFKKQFGGVQKLRDQGVRPGGVAFLERDGRFIYYLVTKEEANHYPKYPVLRKSLEAMRDHCVKNDVQKLSMPTIGCGLDGLKWPNVVGIITDVFKETNVKITVYKWRE